MGRAPWRMSLRGAQMRARVATMAETQLDRIEAMLVAIQHRLDRVVLEDRKQDAMLATLITQGEIMSQEMDSLAAQVEQTLTVEQSAIVLIQGIAAQLADAAGDKAKSLELAAKLKTSADALAAAVTANTPAAPPA